MNAFNETIDSLKNMFYKDTERTIFQRYIEYIRFPFYKNFSENMKIDFSFPITFLVGRNGSGKSSLLQALYGAPDGKNVGDYWFNTALDPIEEAVSKRHCYIYSFKTDIHKKSIEVLRSRINKKENPDFWESARPQTGLRMEKFIYDKEYSDEAALTRWNLVKKDVLYLDFRREIGAFDKYFYFGEKPDTVTMKTKQDLIRHMSPHIKLAHESKKPVTYYRNGICEAPISLAKSELSDINNILGKKYIEGEILEHNMFDRSKIKNMGFSAILKTKFSEYSEAFAGSGETAAVKLVHEIFNAPQYALILLDEPETSLHPGAQTQLVYFLLRQILSKKLQIVISTHSTHIVEGMPKEAIKVFYVDEGDGKTKVVENVLPHEAFFYIGGSRTDKKAIIVEDNLAKIIVEAVLKDLGEAVQNLFEIKFYAGGESVVKSSLITVYSKEWNTIETYVIFDGDKSKSHVPVDEILPRDRTKENLNKFIMGQTDVSIKFNYDSGRPDQEIEQMLDYLRYYEKKVYYLPCKTPEKIIWSDAVLNNADIRDEDKAAITKEEDSKKQYALFSEAMFGISDAKAIEKAHQYFIVRWINYKDDSYNVIVDILNKIKEGK